MKPSAWIAIQEFCSKHKIKLLPNQRRDIQRLAECSGSQLKMRPISEVEAGNLLPVFAELNKLDFDFHVYDVEPCLHI